MDLRVIEQIHLRRNYLYKENHSLNTPTCRGPCNLSVQPQFDYACIASYADSIKNYICFVLFLPCCSHSRLNVCFLEYETLKNFA